MVGSVSNWFLHWFILCYTKNTNFHMFLWLHHLFECLTCIFQLASYVSVHGFLGNSNLQLIIVCFIFILAQEVTKLLQLWQNFVKEDHNRRWNSNWTCIIGLKYSIYLVHPILEPTMVLWPIAIMCRNLGRYWNGHSTAQFPIKQPSLWNEEKTIRSNLSDSGPVRQNSCTGQRFIAFR